MLTTIALSFLLTAAPDPGSGALSPCDGTMTSTGGVEVRYDRLPWSSNGACAGFVIEQTAVNTISVVGLARVEGCNMPAGGVWLSALSKEPVERLRVGLYTESNPYVHDERGLPKRLRNAFLEHGRTKSSSLAFLARDAGARVVPISVGCSEGVVLSKSHQLKIYIRSRNILERIIVKVTNAGAKLESVCKSPMEAALYSCDVQELLNRARNQSPTGSLKLSVIGTLGKNTYYAPSFEVVEWSDM